MKEKSPHLRKISFFTAKSLFKQRERIAFTCITADSFECWYIDSSKVINNITYINFVDKNFDRNKINKTITTIEGKQIYVYDDINTKIEDIISNSSDFTFYKIEE